MNLQSTHKDKNNFCESIFKVAHFTPLFVIHCVFLELCLEKELKDDEVNNGNSLWFKSKEVAVLIHLRVPVAEVAIPAFQSGL